MTFTDSRMAQLSILQVVSLLELYKFKFKSEIPKYLKCVICGNILVNARQLSCGCRACAKCAEIYFQNGIKPCPECNEKDTELDSTIFQDNATNKEISKLEVQCPFQGCMVTDVLKRIGKHINVCEFQEICCTKCGQKCPLKEKEKHDQSFCDRRLKTCKHCQLSIPFEDLNKIHYNYNSGQFCEKLVGFCPNNCELKKKLNLKLHLDKCSKRPYYCPFQKINCQAKQMTRQNLAQHLKTENPNHIVYLIDRFQSIEENIGRTQARITKQTQLAKEMKIVVEKSLSAYEILEKDLDAFQRENAVMVESSDRPVLFINGTLILKISDFQSKRLETEFGESKAVMSDPFYTSQFGYKLCLKVYPGGFGAGRCTHLSVFSVLMKGDFDGLLSWPFHQQVEFSLMDQESGLEHFSNHVTPHEDDLSFQKPINEYNRPFGSATFMPLFDLQSSSTYYKNDTIYVKITVC